ncbi:hypothetical protein CK203_019528 [Vitis vinifera]|uniref:Uncharacterized protein n=1 Tax=Vitis vinifera TaxID=29760 RepID=A0A438IZ49_VITVI|nr:hypothetical protein CK203_019528 [Vitis vinifera]
MDDSFRRASKYSMLEDDICAATQQVLVAGQAERSEATRSFKAPNHPGSSNRGQDERHPPLIRTPLTKSYEKLLPIIRDLPGFRWPKPPLHGEDLLKAGHLKQYVRTVPKDEGSPMAEAHAPQQLLLGQ